MNAIRQIFHDVQESIPVPASMRHQRVEVIFINLDDQTTTYMQPKQELNKQCVTDEWAWLDKFEEFDDNFITAVKKIHDSPIQEHEDLQGFF